VDEPLPGFTVERESVDSALQRPDAGLRIAASRHGEELTVSRLDSLVQRTTEGFTVVFGAPDRGLPEILGGGPNEETAPSEGASDESDGPLARFDLWLNTVPRQGSDVVRTEEAMFATLASLNLER
jgi:predicted SPOUT superfamily RNA methylase MTH1